MNDYIIYCNLDGWLFDLAEISADEVTIEHNEDDNHYSEKGIEVYYIDTTIRNDEWLCDIAELIKENGHMVEMIYTKPTRAIMVDPYIVKFNFISNYKDMDISKLSIEGDPSKIPRILF